MTLYYIMYNPKSSKGSIEKKVNKLYKKTSKKNDCYMINLLEINSREKIFISQCTDEDVIYLCGGDGTLNQFVNRIQGVEAKCKIYFFAMGSGNDYARNYKRRYVEITDLAKNPPKLIVNNEESYTFVNGVGIGVDAEVCRSKAQYKFSEVKKSYFTIALSCIKTFRPYGLDIEIDGEKKHFDNVWFFVCNNGKYFGGGMKVTPKAIINDEYLDLCIVHSLSYKKVLMLFPLIYFGLHRLVRKHVEIVQCKNIKVLTDGCTVMQRDGEVLDYVREIEVER